MDPLSEAVMTGLPARHGTGSVVTLALSGVTMQRLLKSTVAPCRQLTSGQVMVTLGLQTTVNLGLAVAVQSVPCPSPRDALTKSLPLCKGHSTGLSLASAGVAVQKSLMLTTVSGLQVMPVEQVRVTLGSQTADIPMDVVAVQPTPPPSPNATETR